MKSAHKILPIYLLTIVFACNSEDEGPQPNMPGNISGIVIAARDQSPVANAEVAIGSQGTNSAGDGSYELTNVPIGQAAIMAEASGFAPYSASIQIQEGQNTHNIMMEKPSIYEMDPFTMYLSPGTEEVKGVLFYRSPGDARPWIRGDVSVGFDALEGRRLLVELADTYGFAFIGHDRSLTEDFSPFQTMLSALEDFASPSDHPELAHAPLLTFGYSAGGGAAIRFAIAFPERTVGVYAYKGVIYNFSDQDWETIRDIPVFLHIGELDTNVGSLVPGTIPEQFGPNREQGALWAAGIEKGVGHEMNLPVEFITTWMEDLIISRIPDEVTPGAIPVLNVIAEESGWLGDINTLEIMPYAEFQGDPGSSSWLSNEEIAQDWRTFFQ